MEEIPNPSKKLKLSNSSDDEDKISSLPDSIIHHIFSFLYMSDIVPTSLLSRRWRYLWISLPNLHFTDIHSDCQNPLLGRNFFTEQGFINFVKHVLLLHDDSSLHKFSLCSSVSDSCDRIVSLITAAIRRNAYDISLYIHLHETDLKLPECLFTSEIKEFLLHTSMDEYRLSAQLPNSICSAANLTTLSLYWAKFPKADPNGELVLSCPVLETLIIRECDHEHVNVFNISAQRLKWLSVGKYIFTRTKIKICTPILTSLECEGDPYADYFLENLPSLHSAHIRLDVRTEKHAQLFCKILKRLCNVKYLTLSDGWVKVFSEYPSVLAQLSNPFHKLRHLKLPRCRRYCSNAVANLLELSPNIETLVWEITEENSISVAGGDLPLNCVFCNLKDVEVHNLQGCEDEFKLLEFIMKNAVVLKRIRITTTKALSSARERELAEFSNKLQSLSRASSSLNIGFS